MSTPEQNIKLNREQRRKLEKHFHTTSQRIDPIDIGDCYFCGDKVFAPPGTIVKHFNDAPTHKMCRPVETKKQQRLPRKQEKETGDNA